MTQLNVRVMGRDSLRIDATNLSSLANALKRAQVELIGFKWVIKMWNKDNSLNVHWAVPEAYEEHALSSGARTFEWRLEVKPLGQDDGMVRGFDVRFRGGAPGQGSDSKNSGYRKRLLYTKDLPRLNGDSLSLLCTVTLLEPQLVPPPAFLLDSGSGGEELPQDLPAADFAMRFADGTRLRVHRLLLQLASPVFAGLLKELDAQELQLEDDSHAMHLLLGFIYPGHAAKPSLTLRSAAAVAQLAVKYDSAALVGPCIAAMFAHIYTFSTDPDSSGFVLTWLELADLLGSEALVALCARFIASSAMGSRIDKQRLARLSSATLAELLATVLPASSTK
jgi:hypothetical protein